MQFCSFVTEFHQTSTKYSPQYIKKFPYDPHTLGVSQDFHKPTQTAFFNFISEPLIFIVSPFCQRCHSPTTPTLPPTQKKQKQQQQKDKKKINKFGEAFLYDIFQFHRKFPLLEAALLLPTFGTFPQRYIQFQ